MACGETRSQIESLVMPLFTDGYTTLVKGYAPSTIKNMIANVILFLKHTETTFFMRAK